MMHQKFITALAAVALTGSASAATVANYTFETDGSSLASEILGVTATDVAANASSEVALTVATDDGTRYAAGDLILKAGSRDDAGDGGPLTAEEAVATDNYWSFTINITDTVAIDLNELSFYVDRSGDDRGFFIRSSLTGTTDLADYAIDGSNTETGSLAPIAERPGTGDLATSSPNTSILLTDPAFDNLTNTQVTFYFYHTNLSGANFALTFGFDDITVDATVVPEPASLALMGLGAVAMLRRRG